jgi:hypothetical protein
LHLYLLDPEFTGILADPTLLRRSRWLVLPQCPQRYAANTSLLIPSLFFLVLFIIIS